MIVRLTLPLLVAALFLEWPFSDGKKTSGNKISRRSEWGDWQDWSTCSRTCGTGVAYRTRECIAPHRKHPKKNGSKSHKRRLKSNCIGLYKQYKTCNTQECPLGSKDFRQQQCEEFNSKSFRGRKYQWQAFTMSKNPNAYLGVGKCALTCQAKGYRFLARLADHVVDGTRCDLLDPYRICVAGRCRRVGCDGVLDSNIRFDKCGVCGGDNTSCHIISGIFTRRSLPYGYNKVATVPKGACNINITEIMPNANFLALKLSSGKYMINGNWVVGASKEYPTAGTHFRYYRPIPSELHLKGQKEYIIGKGPTNESIDIMLLKQQENHGIMYEYTIPMEQTETISQSATSSLEKDRKRNRIKPQVKVKTPLALTKAEEPLKRPADEGARPSKPVNFQPELHDRYKKYGTNYANYLLGGDTNGGVSNAGGRTDYGVLDVSRPAQDSRNTQTANVRSSNSRDIAPQPPVPNPIQNQANGHRLRHRGRHGGRKIISAYRPSIQKHYDYQASSLGETQSQGSYVYPPVSGVLPSRPIPPVQSAAQTHHTYQQQQQRRTAYNNAQGVQYSPQQHYLTGDARQPQHRYDNIYGSYPGVQQQARWTLNDQIAVNLPGAKYPAAKHIGNIDTGSDYTWRISGFTECSRTCGGGTQSTIIVCVKGTSSAVVTDENCDNALKPEPQSITCNNRLCPPAWEPSDWSTCSTSCGRGTQTRDVTCRQALAASDVRPVSASLCRELPKPDTVRICNEDKPCVRWKIGEWGVCSAECGRGMRTREVVCVNSEDKPLAENKCQGEKAKSSEICDMGSCAKTWFFTTWSDECSTSCGEGKQVRRLFCTADAERCNNIRKPDHTKICRNTIPCGGQWFTGPWEKCSVTCGPGVKKREVLCMKRLGGMLPVGEENCVREDKPESERPCENPECPPQWYMTDWTKCTKTCDTGYQTRDLKCLDAQQQRSSSCREADKPEVWRTCNTMPCPSNTPGQPADQDPSCRDEYNDCRLVVQARLCHYSYYKRACCLSCTDTNNHTNNQNNNHHGHHNNQGKSQHNSHNNHQSNRRKNHRRSGDSKNRRRSKQDRQT